MSASEKATSHSDNALYLVAAGLGAGLSLLLFAGAAGHLSAVWPGLDRLLQSNELAAWGMLLPGAVLFTGGALNAGLSIGLWHGRSVAMRWCLGGNLALAIYLLWLLLAGVPDHPIGLFLALVSSQLLVLTALQAGLVLRDAD